jgi:hypothetical protein
MTYPALRLVILLMFLGGCETSSVNQPAAVTTAVAEGAATPATKADVKEYVGFRPPSSAVNGKTLMPIVFPDGTRATIVGSGALHLSGMTAQLFHSGGLAGTDRTLNFSYGESPTAVRHSGPLATYKGAGDETVELWKSGPGYTTIGRYLVYKFGRWWVAVRAFQGHLTESAQREWAEKLSGRVTGSGFLVLDARPSLTLTDFGGHEGPSVMLYRTDRGTRSSEVDLSGAPGGTCGPPNEEGRAERETMPDGVVVRMTTLGSTPYADWCADGIRVAVQGTRKFVDEAALHLRVRNLTQ